MFEIRNRESLEKLRQRSNQKGNELAVLSIKASQSIKNKMKEKSQLLIRPEIAEARSSEKRYRLQTLSRGRPRIKSTSEGKGLQIVDQSKMREKSEGLGETAGKP